MSASTHHANHLQKVFSSMQTSSLLMLARLARLWKEKPGTRIVNVLSKFQAIIEGSAKHEGSKYTKREREIRKRN